MLREKEIIEMINNVLKGFSTNLVGYKVILFGSRAKGGARDRSDFDLAVTGKNALPVKLFYDIKERLNDLPTLHEIEFIDLNKVSEKFRKEVLKNHKILYE
jgi:predicted nucleotidyltransferase